MRLRYRATEHKLDVSGLAGHVRGSQRNLTALRADQVDEVAHLHARDVVVAADTTERGLELVDQRISRAVRQTKTKHVLNQIAHLGGRVEHDDEETIRLAVSSCVVCGA